MEHVIKKVIIFVFQLFFRSTQISKQNVNFQSIKKICIVRLDNRIGNLILLTPLLEAFRSKFPKAILSLVVGATYPDVLQNNPFVDRIFLYNQKKFIRNPIEWFSFIGNLRREKFDLVVDASHPHSFSLSGGVLTYLTRAKYRLGYKRGESILFLNLNVEPDLERHHSEIHLGLIRYLFTDIKTFQTKVIVSQEQRNELENWLTVSSWYQRKPLIGILVGARGEKQWPVENFINLSERLLEKLWQYQIVWILGPQEEGLLARVPKETKDRITILTELPLKRFIALIEKFKLFISGDTGPMHIAVAVGTPTIEIFLEDKIPYFGYNDQKNNFAFYVKNEPDAVGIIYDAVRNYL